MTEKTLNAIKIAVALLLVAGIGVGLFFGGRWLVDKLDTIFPSDDTTQTDNTQKPGDDTQKPSDTTQTPSDTTQTPSGTTQTQQAFYVDADGYGYRTIDGVTVFFKKFNMANDPGVLASKYETCGYSTVKFYISPELVIPYGSFLVKLSYSLDTVFWSDFGNYSGIEDGQSFSYTYAEIPHSESDEVYLSYTFVTNCANPMAVLNDLKANAFDFGDRPEEGITNPHFQCSGCWLPG